MRTIDTTTLAEVQSTKTYPIQLIKFQVTLNVIELNQIILNYI